jgi:tetratricopeptide (TPR) repeat protein
VPLIVKFPDSRWKGRVVEEQVRSIDVTPTIVETLGIAVPDQMQGRPLGRLLTGEPKGEIPPAFSETYYPYYHFGWSSLTCIRTGRYKYIHAPKPELYDLSADPLEKNNLVSTNVEVASQLKAELKKEYGLLSSGQTKRQPVDAVTMAKLKSLGYIGSGPTRDPEQVSKLSDPKDKVRVYTMLERALRAGEEGRLRESNIQLLQIIREDSSIIDAHLNLGVNLAQGGDLPRAIDSFRRALNLDPRNVIATYNLALAYARLGKLDKAITGFSRTLDLDPQQQQARLDLGRTYELSGKTDAAIDEFKQVIADDPNSAQGHYYLGNTYERKGLIQQARTEWQAAERLGFSAAAEERHAPGKSESVGPDGARRRLK